MINRRSFVAMLAGPLLPTPMAWAAEPQKFTTAAFEQAQAANKPILVDISATWCPTCKAQAPIIQGLAVQDKFKDLVVLEVDFDEQSDIVREFGARSQSTLIVFRGANEVARSVGSTDPAEIESLLAKALQAS